jgi:hypothetical protein
MKLVYFHLNPLQSRRGFEVPKVALRLASVSKIEGGSSMQLGTQRQEPLR